MFKLTLLTISVAMFNVASSQTRVATDNRRLDSLTKFFNTYSINLIVNDTVVKVAAIYEVNKELRKEFAFLKMATDFKKPAGTATPNCK